MRALKGADAAHVERFQFPKGFFHSADWPDGMFPKSLGFTSCFRLVKSPRRAFSEGKAKPGKLTGRSGQLRCC